MNIYDASYARQEICRKYAEKFYKELELDRIVPWTEGEQRFPNLLLLINAAIGEGIEEYLRYENSYTKPYK